MADPRRRTRCPVAITTLRNLKIRCRKPAPPVPPVECAPAKQQIAFWKFCRPSPMHGTILHSTVGFGLLLLIAGTLSVTPGYRHAHEAGDGSHNHSQSHSHGHAHRHGSHAHQHSHAGSEKTGSKIAHVHFGFLGFQWTLPDVSVMFAATVVTTHGDSADANNLAGPVDARFPWSLGHVLQLLMIAGATRPASVCLGTGDLAIWQFARHLPLRGRMPDPPATPPPEQA